MTGRFLRNVFICMSTSVMIVAVACGAAAAANVSWTYRPSPGHVDSSPATGDLDGDGVLDIVVTTTTGGVVALDADGREVWRFDAGGIISTSPTLADIAGDLGFEALAVTNAGRLVCLDGATGDSLWEYLLPGELGWGMMAVATRDLQADGSVEIMVGSMDGTLVCLGGEGSPRWTYQAPGGVNTSPAVADLDGDGKCEIAIGTTKWPLLCISSDGNELWRLERDGAHGSSPIIWDLDADGLPEILVGIGTGLAAVSSGGEILWQYAMSNEIDSAISVGDVDMDSQPEIIAVDLSGKVACLSSTGDEKWTANVKQRTRRSPALGDVDGDGAVEILVGNYDAAVYVFDPDGNLKERVGLNGNMNSTPTIADLRGDGKVSVICATTSADVAALTWMDAAPTTALCVLWPEYRLNACRTGAPIRVKEKPTARVSDVDHGNCYVGSNEFVVTVDNPEETMLMLTLGITKNGGSRARAACSSSDRSFTCRLPYTLFGREAVNIEFYYTLTDQDTLLAQRAHTAYVVPFARDIADLEETLGEIASLLPLVQDPPGVEDQLLRIADRAVEYRDRVATAGLISSGERRQLRDGVAEARSDATRLLGMARAASEAGAVLVAYGANPWAPFGGADELAEYRTSPPQARVEAFGSETESAALNLANFGSDPLTVRVEPADVKSEDGSVSVPARDVLTFHEVLDVPTQLADMSADALPRLGQAQTIVLPGWSIRQLWINVDTAALAPGGWTVPIRFRSLDAASQEASAELSITVWDARLPETQYLRSCNWGYVYSSVLKDQENAALQDQIAHGTNVYVVTTHDTPTAAFDENGELVGEIDFTMHDAFVRRHAPHGILLFFNYQQNLKGPAPHLSVAWNKAHAQWLRAWVRRLAELGVGYDGFALYPVDEPGLREGLVDRFISYARLAREVDSSILIYTDPVERATLDDIKRMAPYVDIWCPNRGGYLLTKGEEKLEYIKAIGKTVWTYECAGNAKHQSPLGYYRAQAWLVWHHGLTGIGFWSYCTSRDDPWYLPGGGNDYLLIYQGNGVVTSKRWEAVRDGIEDYSMLVQLRDGVDRVASTGKATEIVEQARRLLGEQASAIGRFCGGDEDGTVPGSEGPRGVRLVEDRRWQTIQTTRRDVAGLLSKLQKARND